MEATATIPSANGILRIGRKGKRTFVFGDEGADEVQFTVDVVAVYNQWVVIRSQFTDESGGVPDANLEACNKATWQFVMDLTKSEACPNGVQGLTLAEVLEFVAMIGEEKEKLASFFQRKSKDEPSSPPSTELRFSPD
jgi:hypothetical protein